ncbi:type IV secretory system conjugative DNA transfer family protein [Acaryochloris marina]|uniref:TraD/TraG TraM recognition site domain-containing protein n=1 Tax=Acaryochloris marina (strain MBIC 11017) TaxID=329726 RepID=A8ZPT9_ACAM1|nr:TraM recognition domain-containing protein [Acaryochloris marina]ABW33039.1 conserved hypothetical protein [Acaryochloris marina MBIC11017]
MHPPIAQIQTSQTESTPTHPHPPQPSTPFGGINPQLLLMGGCMALLLVPMLFQKYSGQRKGILARARFATAREIHQSKIYARKLIQQNKHNKVALWIQEPKGIIINHQKRQIEIPPDNNSFYVSHLEEHSLILGNTGSGKSYSVLDPFKRSVIKRGQPLFDYDYKGHEESPHSLAPSSSIAGYALDHGYKVYVVAPGFPDTDKFNILDVLKHPQDGANAFQLSNVLNENFKLSASDQGADFFSLAGNQLIQALFMLVKGSEVCADIALAHKILALPNFSKRIAEVQLPQYQKVAFDNYLASADSPETAASIATTASIMFSRFMIPEVLSTFCGQSTMPLEITGRTMVIFRLNPQIEFAVAPLLASIIYLMINRNIYMARKDPVHFFLDEVQTLKVPSLSKVLQVARSAGGCFYLGTQGIDLLESTYGVKETENILTGCKTVFVGQLSHNGTAEYYSKYFGMEDISYKNKSRSHGKGGTNRSEGDQQNTRPLVEIQQLLELPQGQFYCRNRGIGNKKAVRIPVHHQTVIPPWELRDMDKGKQTWKKYRKLRIKQSKIQPLTDQDLETRESVARSLVPDHANVAAGQQAAVRY